MSNLIESLDSVASDEYISESWKNYTDEIISSLKKKNPAEFLRFPIIVWTLHPNSLNLSHQYLTYLLNSDKFTYPIQNAITESPVGKPFLDPSYPLSSPLLIQHGYHLIRLLEFTHINISELQFIVDFGGGYGSICRLFKNLGYTGKYLIYDLPIMCCIQEFYLKNVFLPSQGKQALDNLEWVSGSIIDIEVRIRDINHSLFIATFSLSECPYELRDNVESIISKFKYILIVYQPNFQEFDNIKYFTSLENKLSNFQWHHRPCSIYNGMYYLIGKRI